MSDDWCIENDFVAQKELGLIEKKREEDRFADLDVKREKYIIELERQLAELWNHYNDVEEMYWHTFDIAVGSANTVDRKNLAIMRLKKLISTLREENQEMEILYNDKCAQLNKFVLLS